MRDLFCIISFVYNFSFVDLGGSVTRLVIHQPSRCDKQEVLILEIQGIRVHIVILIFIVGLGLLLGIRQAYQYNKVDQPLSTFFADREEVVSHEINNLGNDMAVKVKLDQVTNLRETYRSLEEGVRKILGGQRFTLEITDARNDQLIRDYYSLHYILQEGLATGRYTEMADAFGHAASERGVEEARVFVDSGRLYVQLVRDSNYLYELIPRGTINDGGKGGQVP